MNELDRVFAAASAVCQEATRRAFGDPHDQRFDVPLAMLLDLDETLGGDLSRGDGDATAASQNGGGRASGLLARSERAS